MDLIKFPSMSNCGHLDIVNLAEARELVEAPGSDSSQGLSV